MIRKFYSYDPCLVIGNNGVKCATEQFEDDRHHDSGCMKWILRAASYQYFMEFGKKEKFSHNVYHKTPRHLVEFVQVLIVYRKINANQITKVFTSL